MKALELATVIESLAKGLSAMQISVPEVEQAAAELRRLAEVNAKLEKDAARYLWLRDIGDETWTPMGRRPGIRFSHEIDRAIDDAIAKAKEQQ